MDEITKKPEFQRILEEAAQYRVLREVVRALDRDGDKRFTPVTRDPRSGNKYRRLGVCLNPVGNRSTPGAARGWCGPLLAVVGRGLKLETVKKKLSVK